MFKLRSMYVNSDDSVHRAAVKQYMNGQALNHDSETGPLYKLGYDPRVTRVDKIIRMVDQIGCQGHGKMPGSTFLGSGSMNSASFFCGCVLSKGPIPN
jgi:hypothetical protein